MTIVTLSIFISVGVQGVLEPNFAVLFWSWPDERLDQTTIDSLLTRTVGSVVSLHAFGM